jgi:hypothetical protein
MEKFAPANKLISIIWFRVVEHLLIVVERLLIRVVLPSVALPRIKFPCGKLDLKSSP